MSHAGCDTECSPGAMRHSKACPRAHTPAEIAAAVAHTEMNVLLEEIDALRGEVLGHRATLNKVRHVLFTASVNESWAHVDAAVDHIEKFLA